MRLTSALVIASLLLVPASIAAQQPDSSKADTTAAAHELPPIEVVGNIRRPPARRRLGRPARVTILDARRWTRTSPGSCRTPCQSSPASRPMTTSAAPTSSTSPAAASTPRRRRPAPRRRRVPRRRAHERARSIPGQLRPAADGSHPAHRNPLRQRSLLGRNALGGAINLVTARGTGPTPGRSSDPAAASGRRAARPVSGRQPEGYRLVCRRQVQPRERLARGHGGRGVPGLREYRQAGETSGIRFQGFYRGTPRETAGSLPETMFDIARLQSQRQRLRKALGVPGVLPGVQAVRPRSRIRHHLLSPPSRRAVQRQSGGRSRCVRHQHNSSFGYTADYRWTTVVNDRTALSMRGGVDGRSGASKIDIYADSLKFGGDGPPTPRRGVRSGTSRLSPRRISRAAK